jgi:hypothetical protein
MRFGRVKSDAAFPTVLYHGPSEFDLPDSSCSTDDVILVLVGTSEPLHAIPKYIGACTEPLAESNF